MADDEHSIDHHDAVDAAECLRQLAFHFRRLEADLHRIHKRGARGAAIYAGLLTSAKALLSAMEVFEEVATRSCCSLSKEDPDDSDALGGFVFLLGVDASKETEQWMRRVRRYNQPTASSK